MFHKIGSVFLLCNGRTYGLFADFGEGSLLQCWDEDFVALQENVIAHVLMKRKLKQPLTFFIGLLDDDQMLVLQEGRADVYLETPGQAELTWLAADIAQLLQHMTPLVRPPYAPQEDPHISHKVKPWWKRWLGLN